MGMIDNDSFENVEENVEEVKEKKVNLEERHKDIEPGIENARCISTDDFENAEHDGELHLFVKVKRDKDDSDVFHSVMKTEIKGLSRKEILTLSTDIQQALIAKALEDMSEKDKFRLAMDMMFSMMGKSDNCECEDCECEEKADEETVDNTDIN